MRPFGELRIYVDGCVLPPTPKASPPDSVRISGVGAPMPGPVMALLEYARGGSPELCAIEALGNGEEVGVDHFLSLSEGPTGLVQTARALRKVLGDHMIPFARDGGGDPFYVDVRTGTIWQSRQDDSAPLLVATSFEDFLDRLTFESDVE